MVTTACMNKALCIPAAAVRSQSAAKPLRAGRRAPLAVASLRGDNAVESQGVKQAMAAGLMALTVSCNAALAPGAHAMASESELTAKGIAFAEATADVLRNVDGEVLKTTLKDVVDVALSAEPQKAFTAVDSLLLAVESADTGKIVKALDTAEKAVHAALGQGVLIPSDAEIDKVVTAVASVGASMDGAKLGDFASAATDAALSADKGKIGKVTGDGIKVGFSVGPGKVAAATKAATDLLLAVN